MASARKLIYAEVRTATLHPNPWNTNHVGPENEIKLEESIKRHGFTKPIVVRTLEDGTLEILGGEHRWRAAKKLGYENVPVVNLGKIDDKQAKEIGLIDNGRYGEDDPLQLAALLKDLGNLEDIQAVLPYSENDLSAIFASTAIDLSELDMPEIGDDAPPPSSAKAAQTHQIFRFKVPIEDADWVTRMIETTMKTQGFTADDQMTNAGNALIHLLKPAKG